MSIEKITSDYLARVLFIGNLPWRCHSAFPMNVANGMKYGGVSALLLSAYSIGDKYTSRWWGTDVAWSDEGAIVPKEASRYPIVSQDGFLNIYNYRQVHSLPLDETEEPDYHGANLLIDQMEERCNIRYIDAGKCFYYYPPVNEIEIPPKSWWRLAQGGVDAFYQCIFHEFMHYTEYFYEWHTRSEPDRELRAEIGAGFLMAEFGISPVGQTIREPGSENARNFRERWIAKMQRNSEYIHSVVNSAIQGVDFLLSLTKQAKVRDGESSIAV